MIDCCFSALWIVFLIISVFCTKNMSQDGKHDAIRKAIQQELLLHPKATLQDLYKNFFQGRFGPGHMIHTIDDAEQYLNKELSEATEFDSLPWQAVGYEKNFYRINLSLVRDGKIDFDELVSAFYESANSVEQPSLESWENEWNLILSIIEGLSLALPNFGQDKLVISENLKKGIVIGHHSAIYQNTYHPHYRIVTKFYFEKFYKMVNKTQDQIL